MSLGFFVPKTQELAQGQRGQIQKKLTAKKIKKEKGGEILEPSDGIGVFCFQIIG